MADLLALPIGKGFAAKGLGVWGSPGREMPMTKCLMSLRVAATLRTDEDAESAWRIVRRSMDCVCAGECPDRETCVRVNERLARQMNMRDMLRRLAELQTA